MVLEPKPCFWPWRRCYAAACEMGPAIEQMAARMVNASRRSGMSGNHSAGEPEELRQISPAAIGRYRLTDDT